MAPRMVSCSCCGQFIAVGVNDRKAGLCRPCRDNPRRDLGDNEIVFDQGYRAYRVVAKILGYTYPQATTRADRERFDLLWTYYLMVGAYVNGSFFRRLCKGKDWDEAKADLDAGRVPDEIVNQLRRMP
jgi:hypothetical protein